MEAQGALSGIRILDLTQVIAGPLGCMLLADLGAEVIKVEPISGEPWRLTGQFFPDESKAYQALNRGKRSIALDLADPAGQEVIRRLVRTCDVVTINYRPDVAARLRVDYQTLSRERPDLVYVDSTAFGRKGPWAHRPGYDIVAQAASGLLMHRLYLDEHGFPALSGPAAPADFATGYAIAWAVCAGLFHRERTGRGQLIETSLLANALMLQGSSFMSVPVADGERRAEFLADLERSRAAGERFDAFVKRRREASETVIGFGMYYRGYHTKDGALVVGCLSPSLRARLLAALEMEDPLPEPTAKSVGAEVIRQVEELFRTKTTAEWMERFDAFGVPASPVWFVEEMLTNPQVLANDYVIELDHELTGPQQMAAPPLKMSDTPPVVRRASPPLGRDTRPLLAELGYAEDEIGAMCATGIARSFDPPDSHRPD
ncbi:MAG: CaiB/BaiF CoA transferase family protein [Hyphomicrobiales bacterium]